MTRSRSTAVSRYSKGEMMKYLVSLQGLGKPSDFGPYEAAEASRGWEL